MRGDGVDELMSELDPHRSGVVVVKLLLKMILRKLSILDRRNHFWVPEVLALAGFVGTAPSHFKLMWPSDIELDTFSMAMKLADPANLLRIIYYIVKARAIDMCTGSCHKSVQEESINARGLVISSDC